MQKNFAANPQINIERSAINRSCGYKSAINASYLYPIFCDYALPGDTFTLKPNIFGRIATPIVPIMDNMYLEMFWVAVPYRLIFDNTAGLFGEQEDPEVPEEYLVPQVQTGSGTWELNSIGDYLGLPVEKTYCNSSALPFRAYNLIYNEWFRPQDIEPKLDVYKDDGPDSSTEYWLVKRAKRHDYFTSCLLWPQKGPDILMPIGGLAPVVGNGNALPFVDGTDGMHFYYATGTVNPGVVSSWQTTGSTVAQNNPSNTNKAIGLAIPGTLASSGLVARLDNTIASTSTVNAWREAFQLQKMLERDARNGTRYTEVIRGHFGIISPDARMQRPEILAMSSKRIAINPVAQTSGTPTYDSENPLTPQGNLAAYGQVFSDSGSWTKSFTEHTVILGIINIRADLSYQQGLDRLHSHRTRYDHYWPSLAHLGEQEVLNKEIFFQGGQSAEDDEVFGYQERYAEYRYKPSLITGVLRSVGATPLHYWHLAEYFENLPTLNSGFIQDNLNTVLLRAIAVQSEPQLIIDCYWDYKCIRPMPVYAIPGLIDHF